MAEVKQGDGGGVSAGRKKKARLGRGLSSLIGTSPVQVGTGEEGNEQRIENGGGAAAPAGGRAAAHEGAGGEEESRLGEPGRREATEPDPRLVVREIPLREIRVNPAQPRRVFDEERLRELALSISQAGVIQPIVVRPLGPEEAAAPGGSGEAEVKIGGGDAWPDAEKKYELIAGERRWRAALYAGLGTIPALVREVGPATSAEWALIENLQRVDLSPLEKGEAFKELISRFNMTHDDVAKRVGLDRTSVTNLVRLTLLEEEIRALLESGALGLGHAKLLMSGAAQGPRRMELVRRAAAEGWSVRELETAVERGDARAPKGEANGTSGGEKEGGEARPDSVTELERQLGEHLGTRVRIKGTKDWKRGKIVIEFFDLDQFDGLMGRFGFVMRE